MGLTMSNVVLFPGHRAVPSSSISRQEFEKLADLALDIVERVICLLDEADENATGEGHHDHREPPAVAPARLTRPRHASISVELLRPKASPGLTGKPSACLVDERPIL
jgi:hypothetical protein